MLLLIWCGSYCFIFFDCDDDFFFEVFSVDVFDCVLLCEGWCKLLLWVIVDLLNLYSWWGGCGYGVFVLEMLQVFVQFGWDLFNEVYFVVCCFEWCSVCLGNYCWVWIYIIGEVVDL